MKAKTYFAVAVVAVSILASGAAIGEEFTGNVGVNSNYIFRGITQTADQSAVSGGIDYAHNSGFHIGAWTSGITPGDYELDLYGGYEFKAGKVELDAGLALYIYPVEQPAGSEIDDYTEAYIKGKLQQFAFGAALTISKDNTSQENDIYLFGTYNMEVRKDLNMALTIGAYNYDDSALEDYFHFQAAFSKSDFTFAIDKNDLSSDGSKTNNGIGSDDFRFSIGWSKKFTL